MTYAKAESPSTATPLKPTWASIAARKTLLPTGNPGMSFEDNVSLSQLEVRITDLRGVRQYGQQQTVRFLRKWRRRRAG
jgi:hypothetical protein